MPFDIRAGANRQTAFIKYRLVIFLVIYSLGGKLANSSHKLEINLISYDIISWWQTGKQHSLYIFDLLG
jgi:hypothetical protein